ncbi:MULTISPECIES: tripartite tricarboxylate transporter substrate binding protein [Cupriavidus]|uniref:tripartite tricarboxylate transporter substrate binding protein n=1 Tax=Cupriavidus TaxID=106589 RepID=UPI00035EDF5B|nr:MULTISPECIES: tripartite tricarboxylate transporter substrate binding protein [Cupriavidus]
MKSKFALASCLVGAVLGAGAAQAAGPYPDKPVRIVVPYPAGGSTDILTRLLAKGLTKRWGQAVVVDNRGGASGIIGTEVAARADPDGYTLLMNGNGPHTINVSLFEKLPYDPVRDFVPIVRGMTIPLLMVAPANAPYNDVKSFIAWAKANKSTANYCSIGPGSPSHLAGELFKSMAALPQLTHVPYKGSGPAIVDTIAGTCHILFDAALSSGPQVKNRKLKLLAIGTEQRDSSWPDTPTVAESGLPGFSAYTWSALFAPAGTPPAIVKKIQQDADAVLRSPELKAALVEQGAQAGGGSSEELARFVDTEIAKWGKVIKDGHITMN